MSRLRRLSGLYVQLGLCVLVTLALVVGLMEIDLPVLLGVLYWVGLSAYLLYRLAWRRGLAQGLYGPRRVMMTTLEDQAGFVPGVDLLVEVRPDGYFVLKNRFGTTGLAWRIKDLSESPYSVPKPVLEQLYAWVEFGPTGDPA